ncbi:MAG: hypothetical protein IPJ00_07625 [Saprospirales bacterium]|nr:hypothetical protein [Saprospirales bacterium]
MKLPQSTRKLEFIDDVVDFKIRNHVRNQIPEKTQGILETRSPFIESNEQYLNYKRPVCGTPGRRLRRGNRYGADQGDRSRIPAPISPRITRLSFSKPIIPPNESQLINFLQNDLLVPDGYYVLLFTCQDNLTSDYKPQQWEGDTTALGTSLFQVLAAQGATQVQSLATLGSRPYNLFYQKNRLDTIYESLGDLSDINELNIPLWGSWTEGALAPHRSAPPANGRTSNGSSAAGIPIRTRST